MKSCWLFFQLLLTSEVFCKQRLLYEHKIMQYLQNCKCYDFYQGHFRKPLQSYEKLHKKNCPKMVHIFFMGCSVSAIFDAWIVIILVLFWQNHLKCIYSKLYLQIIRLKTSQSSLSNHQSVRNNNPLKTFLKKCIFSKLNVKKLNFVINQKYGKKIKTLKSGVKWIDHHAWNYSP